MLAGEPSPINTRGSTAVLGFVALVLLLVGASLVATRMHYQAGYLKGYVGGQLGVHPCRMIDGRPAEETAGVLSGWADASQ